MNNDFKQFLTLSLFLPILILTTMVSPVNVFGFNNEDEKFIHVKDMKKDPTHQNQITQVVVIDTDSSFQKYFETNDEFDLNLRWEPVSNFLGDDF